MAKPSRLKAFLPLLVANLLGDLCAFALRGLEALLLGFKVGDGEGHVHALLPRLVPALLVWHVHTLLLGHAVADLARLVPALLTRLVPALAERVADLLGDGGALFLDDGAADLLLYGVALALQCGYAHLGQNNVKKLSIKNRF